MTTAYTPTEYFRRVALHLAGITTGPDERYMRWVEEAVGIGEQFVDDWRRNPRLALIDQAIARLRQNA